MAKKNSTKRLVIDTNIARSAGDFNAVYPTSKNCRDFLNAMLEDTSHTFVMSSEISAEWNKHQSKFARGWRTTMVAKKRLCLVGSRADNTFVEVAEPDQKDREAMLKDIILVEAALATDELVISMDEKARLPFKRAALVVKELSNIGWVNPDIADEQAIDWLKRGANPEKERLLGNQVPK